MERILLLGSSGLIGSHLGKFLSRYYEVKKFKRTDKNNFINRKFTEKFFEKKEFDIIINLSAITDIDYCEKNKSKAYEINFMITKNIVDSLLKLKKKTYFIFFSTDQFYNNFKNNNEKKKIIKNYYTRTKYLSENYLKKIKSISLRTNFFGKSEKINKRKSFSDFIYYNLKKNKKIYLTDEILFSPLSIRSLNKIIKIICKKKIVGIYNLGSHDGISKYKFGNIFAKKLNLKIDLIKKVSYKNINFFAKRNKDMRMIVKKFEREIKINLPSLSSEIELVVNEYKKI